MPAQKLSLTEGIRFFSDQMEVSPSLYEEVDRLSDGKPGLITGILARMGEAIIEEPESMTTVARIREVLGAPADDAGLPEWQSKFWETLKAEREARRNSDR